MVRRDKSCKVTELFSVTGRSNGKLILFLKEKYEGTRWRNLGLTGKQVDRLTSKYAYTPLIMLKSE